MEACPNSQQENWQQLTYSQLDLHLQWREQGVPTISVLSGEPGSVRNLWLEWITDKNRTTVIWSPAIPQSLFISWLKKLLAVQQLRKQILQYLAALSRCSIEKIQFRLMNKTRYELDIFQQQLPVQISTTGVLLLRWFIDQISFNRKLTPDLATDLAHALHLQEDQDLLESIMAFKEILPSTILPGLLVEIVDYELSHSPVVHSMIQTAESQPGIPLALSILPSTWSHYLVHTAESRIKAMLRTGIIAISQQNAPKSSLPTETNRLLRHYGASSQLIAEAQSVQHALTNANSVDTPAARSQAELFLFRVLELVPDTKNIFKLNVKLPFAFGNQAMEVDLFAEHAQIAIEIDGYYHFQELASWRRDRRKDFELQRKEILVLRFLAGDVVSRLEEILSRIRQALQHSHKKNNEQGHQHENKKNLRIT